MEWNEMELNFNLKREWDEIPDDDEEEELQSSIFNIKMSEEEESAEWILRQL